MKYLSTPTGRLAMATPLMAVLVLGYQLHCCYKEDQSRWKGGGMGMFSSMTTPRYRFVNIYGVVDGEKIPVEKTRRIKFHAANLTAKPTEQLARRLFGSLSGTDWSVVTVTPGMVKDGGKMTGNSQGVSRLQAHQKGRSRSAPGRQPERYLVEVWQIVFDRHSGQATTKLTKEFSS